MVPKKIKVLIIDDSLLFRSQIQLSLKDIPEIEIVGTAANGEIAIEKMRETLIDVCTLDIEMPVLNGLETLKEMRRLGLKTKAIMFSSLSIAGAEKTLEAMNLGAVDFVTKPQSDDSKISPSNKIRDCLLPKILSLFGLGNRRSFSEVLKREKSPFIWNLFYPEVMVIASSTGGPNALVEYFSHLRDPLPFPILVAQHMPPIFTASLAERIGAHSGKVSIEAVHGEILRPNHIYVAPGDFHLSIVGDKQYPKIQLDKGPPRNYVRPCADYLFESAANIFGKNTLGIVFTGMGRDGAEGAAAIKAKRGAVIIQSEESCVVFGMPGAVFEQGNFDFEGTPEEIAKKTLIVSRVRRNGHVA